MKKFKDRYVLGTGYPALGRLHGLSGPDRTAIVMFDNSWGHGGRMILKIPDRLMFEDCPKYRLVLERIK